MRDGRGLADLEQAGGGCLALEHGDEVELADAFRRPGGNFVRVDVAVAVDNGHGMLLVGRLGFGAVSF